MTLHILLFAIGVGITWTCIYQCFMDFDYKTKLFKDWIIPISLVAAFVSFMMWFPVSEIADKLIEYTTTTRLW